VPIRETTKDGKRVTLISPSGNRKKKEKESEREIICLPAPRQDGEKGAGAPVAIRKKEVNHADGKLKKKRGVPLGRQSTAGQVKEAHNNKDMSRIGTLQETFLKRKKRGYQSPEHTN